MRAADVGLDDSRELVEYLPPSCVAHDGKQESLLDEFRGSAVGTARHRAAEVRLVGGRAAVCDQLSLVEDRGHHRQIRRVMNEALVRVVAYVDVARFDVVPAVDTPDRPDEVLERVAVDDGAGRPEKASLGVQELVGAVPRLTHQGRVGRTREEHVHLVHHALELGAYDLGVEGCGEGGHRLSPSHDDIGVQIDLRSPTRRNDGRRVLLIHDRRPVEPLAGGQFAAVVHGP